MFPELQCQAASHPFPSADAHPWGGRAQQKAAAAPQGTYTHTLTHTHTEHLWPPAGEHQNVFLLSSTLVSAVQLDTSWMGLGIPSPAARGATIYYPALLTYTSGEISVPN